MKNSFTNTRITGGELRGREIKSPASAETHPMGSRERLAIMNSLQPYLLDAIILDAYAGSGALGIEALSRGAKFCTFVEKSHHAVVILRDNLVNLKLAEKAEITEEKIENANLMKKAYTVVIFDPPYDKIHDFLMNFHHILANFSALPEKIVVSHPKNIELSSPLLENYTKVEKSYAAANISLFTKIR